MKISNDGDLSRAIVEVRRLSREVGFGQTAEMKISTATSELARNLLKYASGGYITALILMDEERPGIEIVASDQGPGIEDVGAALSNNYSTGGTLGLGLPGVRRMMDDFEISSEVGKGTRITIRHWVL